jgi:hypothetical protein
MSSALSATRGAVSVAPPAPVDEFEATGAQGCAVTIVVPHLVALAPVALAGSIVALAGVDGHRVTGPEPSLREVIDVTGCVAQGPACQDSRLARGVLVDDDVFVDVRISAGVRTSRVVAHEVDVH